MRNPFKRRPHHRHTWRVVGYGGCGWYALACECGGKEIA